MSAPRADHARAASAEAAPLQFNLQGVFAATTAVAIVTAVTLRWGAGPFPLSLGMLLAWCNRRGWLSAVQTPRRRSRLFWLGWLLFASSLLLPSVAGCNGAPIPGWQAAVQAARVEGEMIQSVVREPLTFEPVAALIQFTTINLANVLMLFSPWILWRLHRGRGQLLHGMLCATAPWVWVLSWGDQADDFLYGFYVWSLSFALVLSIARLGEGRWLVMLLSLMFYVALASAA